MQMFTLYGGFLGREESKYHYVEEIMKAIVRSDHGLELVAESAEEAKIITQIGEDGVHLRAWDNVSKMARIIIEPKLPDGMPRESDNSEEVHVVYIAPDGSKIKKVKDMTQQEKDSIRRQVIEDVIAKTKELENNRSGDAE
jgi:hypothetical protein